MKFLPAVCLLLTINMIHGRSFQGYQSGETQNREKRHSNIYQFLQHVLASSSSNFGFPQNNFGQNFPQEFTSFPPPFYQNPGQERFVVNVNQPDSKPTTIINNVHPEYYSMCPCERYVREQNGELQCLCPKQRIFTKCNKNTVCILQNVCDDGLLLDIQYIPQGYNSQSNLCDETTHVCCRIPTEVRKQDDYQIYNHFANTTIDHLNNTVTKYIITGNIYVNNGNPTDQYTTKKEEKVKYVQQQNKPKGNLLNQFPSIPQSVSLSAQPQETGGNPQYFAQPQGAEYNPQYPIQPQGEELKLQYPVQPQVAGLNSEFPVQQQPQYSVQQQLLQQQKEQQQQQQQEQVAEFNPQYSVPESYVPQSPGAEKSVVQLELKSTTSTDRSPSAHTIPPNLVRPTRPTTDTLITLQTNFESKIKEQQNFFTNEITTYRPNVPTANVQSVSEVTTSSLSDLLQPNEIASIFGSPNNPDATVFPGLSDTNLTVEGINLQANANEASTEVSVGVSIIENFPGLLSSMDFPQSSLQVPMKKPESFLSGKIEKLRNTTRTNATTSNQITQSVAKRIFIEQPQATIVFPTNAPAFNQVTGQSFSFQPEPVFMSNNIATPANTNPILRVCPSPMKCVQNMYCTPDGFVSTIPVINSKEEEDRKNMLLNCGNESTGQIGKCCLDKNA